MLGFAALSIVACSETKKEETTETVVEAKDSLRYPEEKYFKNVRQITFGGDNAEAYWSFDNSKLVLQITNKRWNVPCDQIFYVNADAQRDSMPLSMLSTGKGRTTCSYFMPGDTTVVYASTHLASPDCPPVPAPRDDKKYVWPIYESFDIFVADLKGNTIKQLTNTPGYDAEATVSPKGDKIVFTSTRSGDLELYTMNIDGSDVKQITFELGYDGGAFFSPDGTKLVFRSSRPKTPEEIKDYKDLLKQGMVTPTEMEIYTCNVDGSDLKQVTQLGKANWAPFFHPSGQKIMFSSNHKSDRGYQFNLFMMNLDGSGVEQVSFDPVFDAFPMFSPDGKKLCFASNRFNSKNGEKARDTNIFIADWEDIK